MLSDTGFDLPAGVETVGWVAVVGIDRDSSHEDVTRFVECCTHLYQLRAIAQFHQAPYQLDRLRIYRRAQQLVLFSDGGDGLSVLLCALTLLVRMDAPPFCAALKLGTCEGWVTPLVHRDIFGRELAECTKLVNQCLKRSLFGVRIFHDPGGGLATAQERLPQHKPFADCAAIGVVDHDLAARPHDQFEQWLDEQPPFAHGDLVTDVFGDMSLEPIPLPFDEYLNSQPKTISHCVVIAVEMDGFAEWAKQLEAYVDLRSIVTEELTSVYGFSRAGEGDPGPRTLVEYTSTGFRIACSLDLTEAFYDWADTLILALHLAAIPARVGVTYGTITRYRAATLYGEQPIWVFSGDASTRALGLLDELSHPKSVIWEADSRSSSRSVETFEQLAQRVADRDKTHWAKTGRRRPYEVARGWYEFPSWLVAWWGKGPEARKRTAILEPSYDDALFGNLRDAQRIGLHHTWLETLASILILYSAIQWLHSQHWGWSAAAGGTTPILIEITDWLNRFAQSFVPAIDLVELSSQNKALFHYTIVGTFFLVGAVVYATICMFAFESLVMRRVLPCLDRYQLGDKYKEPYARASLRLRSAIKLRDAAQIFELAGVSGLLLWADYSPGVQSFLRALEQFTSGLMPNVQLIRRRRYPAAIEPLDPHEDRNVRPDLRQQRRLLPKRHIRPEAPLLILMLVTTGVLGYAVWGYIVALATMKSPWGQFAVWTASFAIGLVWNLTLTLRLWHPLWSLSIPRRRGLRRTHDAAFRWHRYRWVLEFCKVGWMVLGASMAFKLADRDWKTGAIAGFVGSALIAANIALSRSAPRHRNRLLGDSIGLGTGAKKVLEERSNGRFLLRRPFDVSLWGLFRRGELLSEAMRKLSSRGFHKDDGYVVMDFFGVVQSYGGQLWYALRFSGLQLNVDKTNLGQSYAELDEHGDVVIREASAYSHRHGILSAVANSIVNASSGGRPFLERLRGALW